MLTVLFCSHQACFNVLAIVTYVVLNPTTPPRLPLQVRSKSGLKILCQHERGVPPWNLEEPHWVKDEEAPNCMNGKCQAKFDFIRRRVRGGKHERDITMYTYNISESFRIF